MWPHGVSRLGTSVCDLVQNIHNEYEFGLATVAVQAMFDRKVIADPSQPAKIDTTTKRPYWGSYHVLFEK